MLNIEIKTGNAAFSEDEVLTIEGRYEIARLLRDVAMKIENFYENGKIMDVNGNCCGEWNLN